MNTQSGALDSRIAVIARFFHVEKLPMFSRAGLRSGDLDGLEARLGGAPVEDLWDARAQLDADADRWAAELLAEPAFAEAAARLPFREGDVIVALGDSITDDSLSWAHILDRVLRTTRPGVRVRNHGITGNTTGEVLQRLDIIEADAPTWVIQLLGTNDARRHGSALVKTVSMSETARNLAILTSFTTEHLAARLVAMTPPPTLDAWVDAWQPFDLESITWRAGDVAAVADAVRDAHPDAIDLHTAFLEAGEHLLLEDDGVHPNVDGQKFIVRALVDALGVSPR